jgi:hypothetical protein
VFYASVVKDGDRWLFWNEDLPKETVRAGSEVQLTLRMEKGARYLVDIALDSAEQQSAAVVDADFVAGGLQPLRATQRG